MMHLQAPATNGHYTVKYDPEKLTQKREKEKENDPLYMSANL